jgi:CDP-diacylglycerol---glycerol-3-phosphate 3-phosphatidyltransferase
MNLPNAITLGRIFLVPILVVVLLTNPKDLHLFGLSKELMGALIFGVASFTDWLDGFLARRRRQVTPFGQWMDPLADKLLVSAALISLVQMNIAPAWMVAVILGREYAVTVLRSIAHVKGHALPASPLGKLKMAAQVVAILLLILGRANLSEWVIVGHFALWVATAAALVSAVDYFRHFNAIMSGRPSPPPEPPPLPVPPPAPAPADQTPVRRRVNV